MTSEQRHVYDTVVNSVLQNKPEPFMIDDRAGTGKTFTQNLIASRLRSEGMTVIAVASTGIAALQLPGGWTAYSMFKLPLDEAVTSGAVCNIRNESQRAELLRKCDLIIFDELPMMHKYCIEALDRTLRDLMNTSKIFGNKTVLMSGDWRQTSPTILFAAPADTVDAAFISSHLWQFITRMRLTISQRDKNDAAYSAFVKDVGEDKVPNERFPDGSELMPLSNAYNTSTSDHFTLQHTTEFDSLIDFVYPDLNADTRSLHDRAILATLNASIDQSNQHITTKRPGDDATFYSSDTIITDEDELDPYASPENLHTINVPGVPPHDLKLQDDALTMIARNLNFSEGLVNGQKAVVRLVSPNPRVIQVELLTKERQLVLIPRINFHAKVGKNGTTFQRIQFPLRTAYSLTINKSQGQTLTRIGSDLCSHPFGHGQLYVALSRAQTRSSVMCLVNPNHVVDSVLHVTNVVFPPFVEAATGVFQNTNNNNNNRNGRHSSSNRTTNNNNGRSSNSTNNNGNNNNHQWTLINEIGDGACLLRCLSRHLHGTPNNHNTLRQTIINLISDNLHTQFSDEHTFAAAITSGINNNDEILTCGSPPVQYQSISHYLQLMSHPNAYATFIEMSAFELLHNIKIHVFFPPNRNPPPDVPVPNTCYVQYNSNSQHYQTLHYQLIP